MAEETGYQIRPFHAGTFVFFKDCIPIRIFYMLSRQIKNHYLISQVGFPE